MNERLNASELFVQLCVCRHFLADQWHHYFFCKCRNPDMYSNVFRFFGTWFVCCGCSSATLKEDLHGGKKLVFKKDELPHSDWVIELYSHSWRSPQWFSVWCRHTNQPQCELSVSWVLLDQCVCWHSVRLFFYTLMHEMGTYAALLDLIDEHGAWDSFFSFCTSLYVPLSTARHWNQELFHTQKSFVHDAHRWWGLTDMFNDASPGFSCTQLFSFML